ncbi:MAG: DUF393 domain-containing protein, partial [Acidobacteria bacterium]|nr:DUF393 domain-containing protein [Acidobacteriota bacterium]
MPNASTPLLVFDGDCSFCRLWIDRWKHLTGDRVEYAPFQQVVDRYPQIPLASFKRAVQLIEPSGEVYSGAEAVFRVLRHAPGKGWMHWIYEKAPGMAPAAESVYRLVASHRSGLFTLTRLLWGKRLERPSYELTRWLFLRLLALTYFFAFFSLYTQITGLVGASGILPAGDFLQAVAQALGRERFGVFPTLAWINHSDAFLHFLSLGGAFLSLMAVVGILPVPVFALLWIFYLSLVVIGQDF